MRIIPPRRNEVLTQQGTPTLRFIEYLESLGGMTNASNDQLLLLELFSSLSLLAGADSEPANTPISVITITADYTSFGNEIIICANTLPITITLNPSPLNGEQVHIKRTEELVTVNGDIDGDTSKNIVLKYDAPALVFTDTIAEWSIV